MSDLPDRFDCTVTDWDYIYGRCRDVSDEVRAADFEPDAVVALARGGWFAGRCVCDFLGLDDLISLKVEHYVGTAETGEEPAVRYPLDPDAVASKDVLLVDDIADTGASMRCAREHVSERGVGEVRTATLQLLPTSEFDPDYVGEYLDGWRWIVYPWNFLEDMVDLVSGVMEKEADGPYDAAAVRGLLESYHDIGRIELEVAQPDRLEEVLAEMVRRDRLEETDGGAYRLREG
jgi:hypoxanthine phosphoribosyltransferase